MVLSVSTLVGAAASITPEQVFVGWAAEFPFCYWLDAGRDADAESSWVGVGEPASIADIRAVRVHPAPSSPAEGWVGWFAYESGAARAGAPVHLDGAGEDAWMRTTAAVEFAPAGGAIRVHAETPELAEALAERLSALGPPEPAPEVTPQTQASSRHRPEEYAALIEACREAIRLGDAYQLCLTTRFEMAVDVDPVDAYRRLRAASRAPHGGVIRMADRWLLSASPEQFLAVEDGRIRTDPIKGTRPRGVQQDADAALAEELRSDVKERAENVMIVDLMRNDLTRVCTTGSVTVQRLFEVESHPAVHQLVSTVTGNLVEGVGVGDILDAAFPAGSMTGAPKLSAMTILHRLEGHARGLFAGAFGWVGHSGQMRLAMVIRSVVIEPGRVYVGAGGGITWLSDPAFEVAEVGLKARAPLAAVGVLPPHGW
ncbi:anthranilate synthase component I family protein [Microbacterium sediminicola]|uniref:anthranilate synthase component I family protein n=1 Tax=Microbacterium sediminicola TaxID=415210 RepID=UPI0031D58748